MESYYKLDEVAQVFDLDPSFIQQELENGNLHYSDIDGEKQISLYELKHYFKTRTLSGSNGNGQALSSENLSIDEQ